MRWLSYLFLVAVLISLVYAAITSVTLEYPSNSATNTTSDDIVFGCSGEGSDLTSMTLYSNVLNSSEGFVAVETKSYSSGTVEFNVNNVDNGNYVWNCLLSDGVNEEFASSNYTLNINFPNVEFSGTIPDQTVNEDTNSLDAIDLGSYFSNAVSYSVSGNSHIIVEIEGGSVSFYTEVDWYGNETITFTGTDGTQVSSSVNSNEIDVNVVNINDAPVLIQDIENQEIYMGTTKVLDLTDYFEDIDSILTYQCNNLSHFSVEISDDEIRFTHEGNWTGYENVILTASDGNYSITADTFMVIAVGSSNHEPEITFYYPVSIESLPGGSNQLFNLSYYDQDGDEVTISWYLNDVLVSTNNYYEFENIGEGEYTLIAEINDGFTTNSVSWNFVVGGANETISQTNLCGNGVVDSGENCDNCEEDVKCGDSEVCKDGECIAIKKIPLSTPIILGAILIIGYIAFVLYEKHKIVKIDKERIKKAREELAKEKHEEKLEDYIKNTLKKGFSINEIVREALKIGWSLEEIVNTMNKIKKESNEKDIKSVKEYIKKNLKKNIDLERIKENLLKGGWDKEVIEKAFSELKP